MLSDDVKKFPVEKVRMQDGKYDNIRGYEYEHLIIDGDVEVSGAIHVDGCLEINGSLTLTGGQ